MADNLGWGELGCYGGGALRGAPTPRFDNLAKQGLLLQNYNVEVSDLIQSQAIHATRKPYWREDTREASLMYRVTACLHAPR